MLNQLILFLLAFGGTEVSKYSGSHLRYHANADAVLKTTEKSPGSLDCMLLAQLQSLRMLASNPTEQSFLNTQILLISQLLAPELNTDKRNLRSRSPEEKITELEH